MLVLSRKPGESVELPGLGVKIQILGLRKSRVEVGIDAPTEIEIVRGEMRTAAADGSRRSDHADQDSPRRSLADEVIRLEAQIGLLAELTASENRELAANLTAEANQSLQALKQALGVGRMQRGDARPISQLITVRAEVLQSLRRSQQSAGEPITVPWNRGSSTTPTVGEHTAGYALTQVT